MIPNTRKVARPTIEKTPRTYFQLESSVKLRCARNTLSKCIQLKVEQKTLSENVAIVTHCATIIIRING